MPTSRGFSLIEILISLLLSSMLVLLLLNNLNTLSLYTIHTLKKMSAEDNAISALLLLSHQFRTAAIRECASVDPNVNPALLAKHPELRNPHAYKVLELDDPLITAWHLKSTRIPKGNPLARPLLVQHLLNTFYVNTDTPEITTATGFKAEVGSIVLVDDCEHAWISRISTVNHIPGKKNTITIEGFDLANFKTPFSISHLSSRMYYLGQTTHSTSPAALFRSDGQKREELLPELKALHFTETDKQLEIQVTPEGSQEVYYATP